MIPNPPKLLILDLDETLIHASKQKLAVDEDFRVDKYFVYKRPHLYEFLKAIATHYTIAVWSSAGDDYVHEIIKNITPVETAFAFVWGRSKCTMKRDYTYDTFYFEKKLDKLKKQGYPLEQIIIVDDSPEKALSNYGNAIYIKPFSGQVHDDNELLHLHQYLLTLKHVENIRTVEKRGWRSRYDNK